MGAGRLIARNPLKTVGAVLTGQQVTSDAKKMMNTAQNLGQGVARAAGPTY
jgi:hypothetical protein